MAFQKNTTTAILIFARTSSEEIRHKKIAKGDGLFQTLTEHTLKTVQKTSLPFFHFTEEEQIGSSFGERFSNAIEMVFNQGFEKIITIGNDSPHISTAHLLTASKELQLGKSVIGPSLDGGFYLMGLHRNDYEKQVFTGLSWQTSRIKAEVFKILSSNSNEVSLLPALFDIDSTKDAKIVGNFVSRLCPKVLKAIRLVLFSKNKIEIPSISLYDGQYCSVTYNKGSPLQFTF